MFDHKVGRQVTLEARLAKIVNLLNAEYAKRVKVSNYVRQCVECWLEQGKQQQEYLLVNV